MKRSVSRKEGNRRLRVLAKFLRTEVPASNFDMGVWTSGCVSGRPEDLHKCGTTACALGWATAIPEFKKLGLVLHFQRPVVEEAYSSIGSAMLLFGLEAEDASGLFDPYENSYLFGYDPAEVADIIEDFVAAREAGIV